jgi:hypothetical protein
MNHKNQNPSTEKFMEVELVKNARACRKCTFFWPISGTPQPYGPYPAFDFNENTPVGNAPPTEHTDYPKPWLWQQGTTVKEGFPHPEVMDGCRKAPIMTIGINPNLTAFAPGREGASWCYPLFTDAKGTDSKTKYAWYYRKRSVFQECFDMNFIKKYLMEEGRIVAEKDGYIKSAKRESDAPAYTLEVVYKDDDDGEITKIPLKWTPGTPRYVLLFNPFDYNNHFKAGDVIAARLNVPSGLPVEIHQQQIGYYEQIVPVLLMFENFLRNNGAKGILLHVGEDVAQLDMVACASPHWNPAFLGGTEQSEQTIINNCVVKTGWAVKQFIQTRPAVLFIVGESSYTMFKDAFGNLLQSAKPLPDQPVDYAFTLLKETVENDVVFKFNGNVNGTSFSMETRIVVTPHFSYNENFYCQFRMSQYDWSEFKSKYADCYAYLKSRSGVSIKVPKSAYEYMSVELQKESDKTLTKLKDNYQEAFSYLTDKYYDPHAMMNSVLESLYQKGKLSYSTVSGNSVLTRAEKGCRFCENNGEWRFPDGCPYEKTLEAEPDYDQLEAVAAQIIKQGVARSKTNLSSRKGGAHMSKEITLPKRHGGKSYTPWLTSERMPGLAPIDWKAVNEAKPEWVTDNDWDPDTNRHEIDTVIITWTSAEWAAFDHVFCNSDSTMPHDFERDEKWRREWKYYSNGWEEIEPELTGRSPSKYHKAWGACRIVRFPQMEKNILLFKSDMHISTDGPKLPLRNMVARIIGDFAPKMILTIGTAGGARTVDALGTVNITNAARFDLTKEFDDIDKEFNNKTFSNAWQPSKVILEKLNALLMTTPVTDSELEYLAKKNSRKLVDPDTGQAYPLEKLKNKLITPGDIRPKINVLPSDPVLTTNGYQVANTSGNYATYAAMEMDDAVIAMVAGEHNVSYGIVRNISDPVQNADLAEKVQGNWGGIIYSEYGLYTSFNGALAAWAAIAGQ